jgi:hypothetical protein
MGKEPERTFCPYIEDGVTWLWRTRPSRRNPHEEDRECIISCTGNEYCSRKQPASWGGRGLEGAKPKDKCPICIDNLSCEMLCY